MWTCLGRTLLLYNATPWRRYPSSLGDMFHCQRGSAFIVSVVVIVGGGVSSPPSIEYYSLTPKRTFLEKNIWDIGEEEIHDATLAYLMVGYREIFHNVNIWHCLEMQNKNGVGGGGGINTKVELKMRTMIKIRAMTMIKIRQKTTIPKWICMIGWLLLLSLEVIS